jgi:hypothetical protein
VPQLLKEFLKDTTIKLCGAAIANDVRMLSSYGIEIPSAYDLQKIVPNPAKNLIPSLYDLASATIRTILRRRRGSRRTRRWTRRRTRRRTTRKKKIN